MLKKIFRNCLPALALLVPGVEAEAPVYRWYLEGLLGQASSRASLGEMDRRFEHAGLDARATAFDDTDLAYGAALGYQWHRHWSVEAGVRYLGEFAIDLEGEFTDAAAFYRAVEKLHPESAKGAFIAAAWHWPINPHWSATARLGALEWRGDYDTALRDSDTPVGANKQRGTDPFFGVAAGYHFTPRWSASLGWERFEFKNHAVDFLHLGLVYRFGEVQTKEEPLAAAPAPAPSAPPAATPTAAPRLSEAECKIFTGALSGVTFASGSAELTPTAGLHLQAALDALVQHPSLKIAILAHTDAQGTAEANQVLSEARAAAVKAYFERQGIESDRLTAEGFGEAFPLQDNETSAGRAVNRRVELKLLDSPDCAAP